MSAETHINNVAPRPARTRVSSSWRYRLGYLLYRPWAWLVYVPFLLLSTVVLGSLAILLSPISKSLAFRCGTIWSNGLLLMNFTRVRVHGHEHLRPGQAYVIMPNHQSLIDIPALAGIWDWSFRWVVKQELRKVPFLGGSCAAIGNVFIDRSDRAAAINSLKATAPLLAKGISLMIFPEGTRSADGCLGPFKKGGFRVALDTGLPILPVTILGSRHVLPGGSFALMPGTIELIIHPAIDPAPYGFDGRDRLMSDVRAAIEVGLPTSEKMKKF